MQTPVLGPIGMRFIARVQDRAIVHRIDAQFRFHEVRTLRELIGPGHKTGLLRFHSDLPGSCQQLAADQKRQEAATSCGNGNERDTR